MNNSPRFTWTGDNLTFGGPTFVHFRDEAGRYCFFNVRKVVRIFDDIDTRGQQRIREVMQHVVAHGTNRWRYRYRSLITRSLGGACHG